MKKSITLLAMAFGVTGAFAQDLTSKKGEPILPEAGDWGIAIDATPFLDYFGKIGSGSNTAPTWNFFSTPQVISGRYFKDAQTVYRGSLRIGLTSNTTRTMVSDILKTNAIQPTANGYPNALPMVENKWKRSNTVIGLAGGIEKRKGKTRLQGYYGGEAGIYINMMKDKFTYGNALAATTTSSLNVNVTSADDFGATASNYVTGANSVISGAIGAARATEIKHGTVFSFGVRGFIGAEYFVLPKMSIGGEFGWGIGLSTTGKGESEWESIGNSGSGNNSVGSTTIEESKTGSFTLDTDGKNSVWGPSGAIRLNLYF